MKNDVKLIRIGFNNYVKTDCYPTVLFTVECVVYAFVAFLMFTISFNLSIARLEENTAVYSLFRILNFVFFLLIGYDDMHGGIIFIYKLIVNFVFNIDARQYTYEIKEHKPVVANMLKKEILIIIVFSIIYCINILYTPTTKIYSLIISMILEFFASIFLVILNTTVRRNIIGILFGS